MLQLDASSEPHRRHVADAQPQHNSTLDPAHREQAGRVRLPLGPSLRVLTARAMLRNGRDPVAIASCTHVPLELVQLLQQEMQAPAAASTRPIR